MMYWPFSIPKPLVCSSFGTSSSVSPSMKTRLTRLPVALLIVVKVILSEVLRPCKVPLRQRLRRLDEALPLGPVSARHTRYSRNTTGESSSGEVIRSDSKRIIFQWLSAVCANLIPGAPTGTIGGWDRRRVM